MLRVEGKDTMDTVFCVQAEDCQAFGGGGDWNSVLIIPEPLGHG